MRNSWGVVLRVHLCYNKIRDREKTRATWFFLLHYVSKKIIKEKKGKYPDFLSLIGSILISCVLLKKKKIISPFQSNLRLPSFNFWGHIGTVMCPFFNFERKIWDLNGDYVSAFFISSFSCASEFWMATVTGRCRDSLIIVLILRAQFQ